MDGLFSKLRNLDAYPKINEDFYSRTLSGGVITLFSSVVMVLLFVSELRTYCLFSVRGFAIRVVFFFFFVFFLGLCNRAIAPVSGVDSVFLRASGSFPLPEIANCGLMLELATCC